MARNYYTDYVQHMIKFYVKTIRDNDDMTKFKFNSNADKLNWELVDKVVKQDTSKLEFEIVYRLYSSREEISKQIVSLAAEYDRDVEELWNILRDFVNKLAKERQLI